MNTIKIKKSVAAIAAMTMAVSSMGLPAAAADDNSISMSIADISDADVSDAVTVTDADAGINTADYESEDAGDTDLGFDITEGDIFDSAGMTDVGEAMFGVPYSGSIGTYNPGDRYTFKLSESGVVTINVTTNKPLDFAISDSKNNIIDSTSLTQSGEFSMRLIAGDYRVIALAKTDNSAESPVARVSANYSFTASFTSANETVPESETSNNGSVNKASEITLEAAAKGIKGQVGPNDINDFYKITVDAGDVITFDGHIDFKGQIVIWDSKNNEIRRSKRIDPNGDTARTFDTTFKDGGVYYIQIHSDGKPNGATYDSDSYGAYDFKLTKHVADGVPITDSTPGNGTMTLKWDAVPGADKYAVYSCFKKADGTVKWSANQQTTATTYTMKGLVNNRRYGFFVRAHQNGVWTTHDRSTDACCSRFDTPQVPATNFEIVPVDTGTGTKPDRSGNVKSGNGYINVKWDAVPGADKYRVYLFGPSGKEKLIRTPDGKDEFSATARSCTIPDVYNQQRYGVVVRAHANGGWYRYSKNDCIYTIPQTPKTNFKATAGVGSVKVTWDPVPDATLYRVYYYDYTEKKYYLASGKNSLPGTTRSFTITGLKSKTKYGIVVRAFANKGWYIYSDDATGYYTKDYDCRQNVTTK